MPMTMDQVTEVSDLQAVVASFISILNQQTYLDPTLRVSSGLSNANIAAINVTIADILSAINTIVTTP